MIKESIYIKNIGPLVEVNITEIKPITVFIGPSASGKSTIMKVIALMRYIYKLVNIRSYLKSSGISKAPFNIHFRSLLHDGLDKMFSADSEIRYEVFIGGRAYTIEYRARKLRANILVSPEDLIFCKESYISDTRGAIPTWTSKVASNKGAKLGFYFHETFSDFDEATDLIDEQGFDYFGFSMRVQRGSNQRKRIVLSDAEGKLPAIDLHHASSGIQTSVPLLVLLRYFARGFSFKEAFRRSVLSYLYEGNRLSDFQPSIEPKDIPNYLHVHIEEPELSLDPEAQMWLLGSMLRLMLTEAESDRKLGMMVATHSPYIVNMLNVYLRAGYSQDQEIRSLYPLLREGDLSVYRVDGGMVHSLMATNNNNGQAVVNAIDLSEPMARIHQYYIDIP